MTLWEAVSTIVGSFGTCFAASLLPMGGAAEAYVLATSVLLPAGFLMPLVLASAAGSVAAKVIVYLGARGVVSLPRVLRRSTEHPLSAQIRNGSWVRRGVILGGSTLGIPPFYAVAVACGTFGVSSVEFAVLGFAGQSLRFGAVWSIPRVVSIFTTGA